MLNFNVDPYFDDFDEGNKFYRILYRPSYAVQGRELTQSQSITQEQIKKFGDHIFQHGAMVIPGQITLDSQVSYQKMVDTYGGNDVDGANFLGYTVIGDSSGVEGDIVNVAAKNSTDPLTFFVKFKDSGDTNVAIGFWDGETIYRKDNNQIRATVEGTLVDNLTPEEELDRVYDSTGKASLVSIDKGIYYIDGMFVNNDAQSIVVSKYDRIPTCRVGLRVYESVVTPEEDISLTDNAQGSPNYAAPGAHRYKIDLKLEYIDIDDDLSDDFIILQVLRQGTVVKEIRITEYSELEKTFARRTFDESGDYTVNPFQIIMKEHLRDENDVQFKEGTYFAPYGDETKIVAEMGTGKGYVQGYEISKIAKSNVEIDKARDFAISNNSITNFSLGNYIKIDNSHNVPRIDTLDEVQLWDTVSVTPGTPGAGQQVGTAKVRAIKRFGNISYLYLFDISMLINTGTTPFNFEDTVRWIYDTNGVSNNNFTAECVVEAEGTKVFLYNTANNILLFSLPDPVIKTLSVGGSGIDTNYASSRAYYNTGVVANTATLVAQDDEVFQQNTESYYVADFSTGVQYDNSTLTFNFTGSPVAKVLEISSLSGTVNVVAPVNKSIATQKTKYLQEDATITIASPSKVPNGQNSLEKADVVRIKSVVMGGVTDVTDRYQLDTGCRDNYYDVSSIVLVSGKPAPTDSLLVTFDYFTHTGGDYFSIDSYVDIEFDEIPVYRSNAGRAYSLADCFDFRPRKADDGADFIGTGASVGELPQVFTDITSDYEYYLNRIDYLYLDYGGEFMVSKGVPAVYPRPPEKPEMGMVLYEVYIPAYTFKPSDANPQYKDNKRYTMRDIGKLDTRIGNLEYYTALSLLERETASMEILDGNGLNRFKNGFIVDPFDSHKVGEATHSDYNCSIDPNQKLMRAKFNDENIGLLYDGPNSSHVQRTGGIVTLPYTETAINKQTQASKYENINPYAFRNIFGKLTFNPDSDVWHDKEILPTLVVDHSPNYEALKYIADNTSDLNGVEWGRWNDVGGRKNEATTTKKSSSTSVESRQDTGISHDEGWLKKTTTTSVTSTTSWEQDQERTGIKQTNTDETVVSKSLGDRITEVNYIPYMRSIPVVIKTDQMKKKTKVYPFFDDISMSSHCDPPSQHEYCIPASKIESTAITGLFYTANYAEEVIQGGSSGATAIVMYQTENYVLIVNMKGTFQVGETVTGVESGATLVMDAVTINSLGDPIVTGDLGEVVMIWIIPNDDVLTFMTGEREFVLTDQITNADPVHTTAKGMFKSHGMGSKQENTVLSTKTIKFTKEPVKQNRTVQRSETTSSSKTNKSGWYDPVAQSFLINETGGCFLTKVRVWFQNKDTEEGVVCEIRNMVNGYPDQIAMADTVVQPANISISEREPGEPTDFYFPEPIYLKEGEDYCFVLKPCVASASHTVWVSETGRLDISSGEIITGKMSLGSFFKSQNASTWTANQNEDIMFELSKAVFDINSDGNCHLVNDIIRPESLGINPFDTVFQSDKIRIYQKDHGLTETSVYNISGLEPGTDYNGFLGSQLNGDHLILDTEIDSFVIQILGTFATSSGLTGGTEVMSTRNYQLDVAHPLVNELLIDETSINWTLATTSGQSVSGTQTPFVAQSAIDIINNEDIDMAKPMLIASPYNEDQYLSGEKSLTMVGTMHSDNENVSPVVDAANYDASTEDGEDLYFKQSSSTFIAISNRIDEPSTTSIVVGTDQIFEVDVGEDELNVTLADHDMGTGSFVFISDFNDTIPGVTTFDPNGLHEIRVVNKDEFLIDMDEVTTGAYTGSGDDTSTNNETQLAYSTSHYIYVPETRSFDCSTSSRYMTKQITLADPAENIKIFFGAVRQQEADIDVYFKTRSPYEVTEWNEIPWVRLDTPDENVAISESNTDFKDYTFTVELDDVDSLLVEPFNAISVKLVMKSTNSTQVPIFQDLRIICTT